MINCEGSKTSFRLVFTTKGFRVFWKPWTRTAFVFLVDGSKSTTTQLLRRSMSFSEDRYLGYNMVLFCRSFNGAWSWLKRGMDARLCRLPNLPRHRCLRSCWCQRHHSASHGHNWKICNNIARPILDISQHIAGLNVFEQPKNTKLAKHMGCVAPHCSDKWLQV